MSFVKSFLSPRKRLGSQNRPGRRRGQEPPGKCVCPSCGKEIPHRTGVPCSSENCPECGQRMVRK